MARQHKHTHLIGGALALGVVFVSGAAFAQSSTYQYPIGRPVDDGGLVSGAVNTNPQTFNYAAPQQSEYHYPIGRPVDDGGLVAEPAAPVPAPVRHISYRHRNKSASR